MWARASRFVPALCLRLRSHNRRVSALHAPLLIRGHARRARAQRAPLPLNPPARTPGHQRRPHHHARSTLRHKSVAARCCRLQPQFAPCRQSRDHSALCFGRWRIIGPQKVENDDRETGGGRHAPSPCHALPLTVRVTRTSCGRGRKPPGLRVAGG